MDPKIRSPGSCCSLDSNRSKEEQSPVKKPRVEKCDCLLSKEEEDPYNNLIDYSDEYLLQMNFTEERRAEYINYVKKTEGRVLGYSKKNKIVKEDLFNEDYAKYMEQIRQSGGYDVDKFPESDDFGVIAPLLDFKEDPEWFDISKQCSMSAIEKYNEEKNTNYEIFDVEKINIQAVRGFNCWITFLAKDLEDPDPTVEPKTFQAKVYHGIHEVVVDQCRLKESS